MELGVEGDELLGGQRGVVHRGQRRAHVGEVVLGLRRERADHPLLQQEARGDDVGDREPLRRHLQPQERRQSAARRRDDDGAGRRPRAGAGADEAHHLEHAQRFTDARAADAERRGELALGGEAVAGCEPALEQVGLDLLEHHPPCASRGGGDVVCHGESSSLWSGHDTTRGQTMQAGGFSRAARRTPADSSRRTSTRR